MLPPLLALALSTANREPQTGARGGIRIASTRGARTARGRGSPAGDAHGPGPHAAKPRRAAAREVGIRQGSDV